MKIKLFDSELKIMDVLWKNGDTTAKQIAAILKNNHTRLQSKYFCNAKCD